MPYPVAGCKQELDAFCPFRSHREWIFQSGNMQNISAYNYIAILSTEVITRLSRLETVPGFRMCHPDLF